MITGARRLRPLDTHAGTREYLRSVWARRDFMFALPTEQLRTRHQDTFLGNLWHLGNPLLTVAVYYLVFGGLLGVSRGIDNYVLWLMIGVFAYRLTSSTVQGGATAISSNQGLIRSFRFPRAILPVSETIGELLTFAFQLGVIACLAIGTGEGISRRWLALPVVLVLHTVLNLGGAFVMARLNDAFQDVNQLIPFVFRLLQYLSGVMFPLDRFLQAEGEHAWLHRIIVLNPIVAILDVYRWVFMGTAVDLAALARSATISVLVLVFGFRFFRAAEHRYGRP